MLLKAALVATPLRVAVTLPLLFVSTWAAVTVKVAEVAPALTVTVAGTVTPDTLVERVIERPPVGATELSVTVPVAVVAPVTEFGLIARLEIVGA